MALPIEGISDAISGIAALGIAAYGLVDASKALRGGASNHGLSDISDAITPFDTAFGAAWRKTAAATLTANWLNGVAKDEQKAAAKGLVRLGLTATTARLVAVGTNVDAEALATAAQNIEAGTALTQKDLNVLGRFDAQVSAILDAAYERADQQYRNAAKLWACVVAVLLAIVASACQNDAMTAKDWMVAIVIGLVATPLAPLAKDLASSLQSAVGALNVARK